VSDPGREQSGGPVDVNTFIGPYPFRYVPHPDAEVLPRVLAREGLRGAWVGHLPSAFYRDPTPGNAALFAALEPHASVLSPVPTIRPDWPGWERALDEAIRRKAPAVRIYPPQWGLGPGDTRVTAFVRACGDAGVVVLLTTRFEDGRQRHWMDTAGDLTGAHVRAVARASVRTRIIVTAAGRDLIEESHWGLTADEQSRLWWDISWVWGPPEDHLAHLMRTVGPDRFVFGSQWPLRLTQTPRANLDLLPAELASVPLADASTITNAAIGAATHRRANVAAR
jgi:predicted TIM-barrel fold metal-dependent hydrolase